MDSDATDLGLGIAGLMVLGLSAICLCWNITCNVCKDYKHKNQILLNNGEDIISEV